MATDSVILVQRALALSRTGDIDAALATVREVPRGAPNIEAADALHWMLLRASGAIADAMALADTVLNTPQRTAGSESALSTLQESTWRLRRGMLAAETGAAPQALSDLQDVLRLRASESHVKQAQRVLLEVASHLKGRVH